MDSSIQKYNGISEEIIDQIGKNFPKGFYKKKDKEGNIVLDDKGQEIILKTKLDSGDCTGTLNKHFQQKLRYNLLKLRVEFNHVEVPQDLIKNFYIFLSIFGYHCSPKFAEDSVMWTAHQNNFHPIVEFIETLEKDKNIVPVDIDNIATKYLKTTDDLSNNMMKITLVGMIARVMNRGCKFDTCLTLRGSQGIGKSSFFRILAGTENFCDTWCDNIKDLFFNIQTCWVFELAELDGMTNKKDAAQIKSLLSSANDIFRRPYEAKNDPHPRPSIFVGTCNRGDFLVDETGSRRFHIIELGDRKIDLELLEKDRLSILKSALLAYRSGAKTYLDHTDQERSNLNNLSYEKEHPFLTAIHQWVEDPRMIHEENGSVYRSEPLDLQEGITTRDVIIHSKVREAKRITPSDVRAAADCLRTLGFEQDKNQIRTSEGRVRLWRKK